MFYVFRDYYSGKLAIFNSKEKFFDFLNDFDTEMFKNCNEHIKRGEDFNFNEFKEEDLNPTFKKWDTKEE